MRRVIALAVIIGALMWLGSALGLGMPAITADGTRDAVNAAGRGLTTGADSLATIVSGVSPQVWTILAILGVVAVVLTFVRRNPYIMLAVAFLTIIAVVAK